MQIQFDRYFTLVLLGFLVSFVVLPSPKAVNNYFYILMGVPALLLMLMGKAPRKRLTLAGWLWLMLFAWMAIEGVLNGDYRFYKHLLYVVVFCAAIFLWVDYKFFEREDLVQKLFWGLALYVVGSAVFLWVSGEVQVGERVLLMPSRMSGPILTSMIMVSAFAFLLPGWVQSQRWIEIGLSIAVILFCAGYILQSRTGLLGLLIVFTCLISYVFMSSSWRVKVVVVLAMCLIVSGGIWLIGQSDVGPRLVDRADAGRFELWASYWKEWASCGFWVGCGPLFSGEIYVNNRLLIQHPHNIFLGMGFYHGLPALLLFTAVIAVTLFQAWHQKNSWGIYLLIALVMLNFDGRELVSSPHEVWLLVLLPAMLINSRQAKEVEENFKVSRRSDPIA